MLGKSESIGNSTDLFASLNEPNKVYSRKSVPGRFIHVAAKRKEEVLANGKPRAIKEQNPNDDFQRNADDVILSKSAAGVIVNDQMQLVSSDGMFPLMTLPTISLVSTEKYIRQF